MSKDVAKERARLEQKMRGGNPSDVIAATTKLRQLNTATSGSGVTPPPEAGGTFGLRISPPKVGAGDLRLPLIGGIR